jgi:hypothetical protein
MKMKKGHLFIDDGYPEALEYEDNYVSWDPQVPGSLESALVEAKRVC